jgi:hypothetical protein
MNWLQSLSESLKKTTERYQLAIVKEQPHSF